MAEEPENLMLVFVRRIDGTVQEVARDQREMKERLISLELGQAGIRRALAVLSETDARLQAGIDRLRDDVQRIKRRLDLTEAPSEA